MAVPHWEADGDPWDVLALGDGVLPGVWSVVPVSTVNIDVKIRRGADGARIRDRGVDLVRLRIEGQVLATDPEWPAFEKALKSLVPRRGAKRGAMSISHPVTEIYRVSAVVIEAIEGPEIRDGIGVVSIDALEWVAKPKTKKPEQPFTGDFVYGADYPNWQRTSSPWLSYEPPSANVDLDALIEIES